MVEIAKALISDIKVIIMDEPTAALTNNETEHLFKIIKSLKQNGVSIIYISHRMEEIFELCDRITVMRDGEFIGTKNIKDTLAGLKKSAGFVRSEVAKRVNLRNTPEIIFKLDDSIEYGSKIDSILKEIMPKKED